MKMEFDITKMVEEIAMQAKENQEEFIFQTIRPYCENILQIKINKEELKQILLNHIQKQQPCEDECIEKGEAIRRIEVRRDITCKSDPYSYEEWTKGYEEGIDDAIAMINSVPSVTPTRPKGKWIDDSKEDSYYANCSHCDYQIDTHYERGYLNYCPNCGAKMEVEE